jgi:hypothetical protein
MSGLKVLVFTTSYNRLDRLRGCLLSIKSQTYPSAHSVRICVDEENLDKDYSFLYSDITSEFLEVKVAENSNQLENHIKSILEFSNFEDYELFVKVDDDDLYKSRYVENIVSFFKEKSPDITSSAIKFQINNGKMYEGPYNNLGGNPGESEYKMPMTFAFNKKALDVILNLEESNQFEDLLWRDAWTSAGLVHEPMDNSDQVIWNIHGKNISTHSFLRNN